MVLEKRTNQFARITTHQKNGKKGFGVQYSTEEGVFYGKIWTLYTHRANIDELINYVRSLPYCAKLKGYQVYLTLSYFCGPKDMPNRYDLQDIADRMLIYFYDTYLKDEDYLLRVCTERD